MAQMSIGDLEEMASNRTCFFIQWLITIKNLGSLSSTRMGSSSNISIK
jgi:hypothetical protein